MFTRNDRKIANLEAKIKNRDRLIGDLLDINSVLKSIINSLEDEKKCLLEEVYKKELSQTTNQE